MEVALLQLNFLVGDVGGNSDKIKQAIYNTAPVDLFVTSELALVGYPPRDLLFNVGLMSQVEDQLDQLARQLDGHPPLLIGAPEWNKSGRGKPLYNSTFLLHQGQIIQSFQKSLLPNYDVFDEARYFESSHHTQSIELGGQKIGVTICEDIWNDQLAQPVPLYGNNPISNLKDQSIDLIVNLSSSPFSLGKHQQKQGMLSGISKAHQIPVIYVNQVGGNDDLIFDGRSMVFDAQGQKIAEAKAFEEDILIVDLDSTKHQISIALSEEEEIFTALVTGVRDYVHKCGFTEVILGLSGGIDSALVAVIAAQALGPDHVTVLAMPSPFSSESSLIDAKVLATRLKTSLLQIPIGDLMESYQQALEPGFQQEAKDITAQNLQARIRGTLLMAHANQNGAMLLSTGNKSELSVGYCTLYGDMAGALAVIADLPKMRVYQLARWINRTQGELIPESILTKAPSAELKPNQKDEDSLPPYDILDAILLRFIEQRMSLEGIIAEGFDRETVTQVIRMVQIAEFKRQQSPPPIKIHPLAFGTGWRMPLAAKLI